MTNQNSSRENDKHASGRNLNSSNSRITEPGRSVHKLKQYSRRECIEIAGMPWVIPHVIPKDVVIKLLNKIEMNFFKKNDLAACHRLAHSDKTIIKDLNRNHAQQIMTNKSKVKAEEEIPDFI